MRNAKHTPGPWMIEARHKSGEIVAGSRREIDIATVWTPGEEWANAKLIAQAPAMADALKAALEWEAGTRSRLGLPQIDAPDWAQAGRASLGAAGRI